MDITVRTSKAKIFLLFGLFLAARKSEKVTVTTDWLAIDTGFGSSCLFWLLMTNYHWLGSAKMPSAAVECTFGTWITRVYCIAWLSYLWGSSQERFIYISSEKTGAASSFLLSKYLPWSLVRSFFDRSIFSFQETQFDNRIEEKLWCAQSLFSSSSLWLKWSWSSLSVSIKSVPSDSIVSHSCVSSRRRQPSNRFLVQVSSKWISDRILFSSPSV